MTDYFNGAHNAAEEHFRDCGASTLGECIQDDARRYGAEHEDVEWIPNDFDTSTHNPYYTDLPTPHPEDAGYYGEAYEMELKIDFAIRKYLAIVQSSMKRNHHVDPPKIVDDCPF